MSNIVNVVCYVEMNIAVCVPEHAEKLLRLAESAPDGCFVECGVARGGTAAVMESVAVKTRRRLYLCDSFTGFPKPEPIDANATIVEGQYREFTQDIVARNLHRCGFANLSNVVWVPGYYDKTMPELAKSIGNVIALLHVDCDLYGSTKAVLDALVPKMVKGGAILFHDYPYFDGVRKAAYEHFKPEDFKEIGGGGAYVGIP
jgi:hypothetical protein